LSIDTPPSDPLIPIRRSILERLKVPLKYFLKVDSLAPPELLLAMKVCVMDKYMLYLLESAIDSPEGSGKAAELSKILSVADNSLLECRAYEALLGTLISKWNRSVLFKLQSKGV
jgi:hypothetical protein